MATFLNVGRRYLNLDQIITVDLDVEVRTTRSLTDRGASVRFVNNQTFELDAAEALVIQDALSGLQEIKNAPMGALTSP